MKASRASAGLTGAIGASLVGAVLVGGSGAKDHTTAQQLESATDERLRTREAASEKRRRETNDRVVSLGSVQQQCLEDVVERMKAFLRRNHKQVRDMEHPLVDGVEVEVNLVEHFNGLELDDIATWTAGAASAGLVGTGSAAAARTAVHRYGVAGTGKKISELYGAALESAALAFLGGGTKADGGGGVARGKLLSRGLSGSVGLLVAALVTKAMGRKALAEAQERATEASLWCGEQDLFDVFLDAVDMRVAELSTILRGLRTPALAALEAVETLESVPFDIHQHGEQFQRAWILVLAVRDAANATILDEDGNLDGQTTALIVKYRPLTKEVDDA